MDGEATSRRRHRGAQAACWQRLGLTIGRRRWSLLAARSSTSGFRSTGGSSAAAAASAAAEGGLVTDLNTELPQM